MRNSSRAAVDASKRKKRKKGRPSLLDLQKRSLRLQNQQQNNRSPNPNPSPKFPQSNAPSASRRVTRRNPDPSQDEPPRSPPEAGRDEEKEEEEDGVSGGKRREKKLKLVLRLPSRSGSESDGAANADPKRRKIGHEDRDKKNFENLRQDGNDNEPEPKTVVRRGRPPNKHKKVGRPPADHAASDFSTDVTLANAGDANHLSNLAHDSLRKGSSGDKSGIANASNRASYGLHCTDTCGLISEQKADRDEEYSEYAYARSLARFAAKLGPIGWLLAARKIQRVLPPGTKFGPGWVADGEAPQHSQPLVPSVSPLHPLAKSCASSTIDKHSHGQEMPHNDVIVKEGRINGTTLPASTLAVSSNVSSFPEDPSLSSVPSHENGSSTLVNGGMDGDAIRPKVPFQHHQNPGMHPAIDGLSGSFNSNMVSQLGKMIRPAGMLYGPFGSDAQMSHARALDMVSRANNNYIQQTAERLTVVGNSSMANSGKLLKEAGNDSKGPWQSTTLQWKPHSAAPDLNVGFQSPGSPASDVVVVSQQPDLALQL
ncbi:hypothetical protein BHM03_00049163 [Ensete ventricosum]|nr:hypothetical protein BHM03_00049163 [Ensete ventricosum]